MAEKNWQPVAILLDSLGILSLEQLYLIRRKLDEELDKDYRVQQANDGIAEYMRYPAK